MKQKLLILSFLSSFAFYAQTPIFNSSMTAVIYGSSSSPSNEGVQNIIDNNVNTKYLDFNAFDGFGFSVNTGTTNAYVATRIDVTTANDFEQRDPTIFEVSGSTNGSTYTVIATGTIPCVATRFFTRSFTFTNNTSYPYYRVNFLTQCNNSEAIFQLAEVQLYGNLLATDSFKFNSNSIKIAPNPNNGNFVILNSNSSTIDKITVVDILGKVVKEETFLNGTIENEISVSGILSGIYFVKIASDGKEIVKKLIVN